ncbi:MAG: hypothetical protein WEE89_17245 [Gemmatimonadota bacterium]
MRCSALVSLFLVFAVTPALRAQNDGGRITDLIRSALSAAPASVSDGATVVDLHNKVLRTGTNGWVCMPDNPDVPNNSPMCLDERWREFMDAYMNKRRPAFRGTGFGYMLQGDFPASNTDPFAPRPTPSNQWVANAGSHVMMILSDAALLDGLPTDPKNGGPWVMWKGTPYAHVMIPAVSRNP